MQNTVIPSFFLVATVLAASASDATSSSIIESTHSDDTVDSKGLVPDPFLAVLEILNPSPWHRDIVDSASLSATTTAAAAGVYPDKYNELPSSVKSWVIDFNHEAIKVLDVREFDTGITEDNSLDSPSSTTINKIFSSVITNTPDAFAMNPIPPPGHDTGKKDEAPEAGGVPNSILTVIATAVPASWYNNLMDPASSSSIFSAASADIYPEWYSKLPDSVKAWVTANSGGRLVGAWTTADGSTIPTESAGSVPTDTGTSTATVQTSVSTVEATMTSPTESHSSSDSQSPSNSVFSSPSLSNSVGSAPIAASYVAFSVAGVTSVLAPALFF